MMLRRTPIPAISAKQRTKRVEAGEQFITSTIRPSRPVKAKASKDTGPDQATVDACLERDSHSCVVCGGALHGQRGVDWSIHHRKLRSQGGDNRLSNLISVCGHGSAGCHSDIHAAPAKAREAGWMLRRDDDPAEMVMAHSQRGFGRLTDDGGFNQTRPEKVSA